MVGEDNKQISKVDTPTTQTAALTSKLSNSNLPDSTHSHVLDHSYSLIDLCLNIHVLNVCGLKSKLLCPDFLNLISQHDILVFTETKWDDVDIKNVRSEFANLGYSTFIKKQILNF